MSAPYPPPPDYPQQQGPGGPPMPPPPFPPPQPAVPVAGGLAMKRRNPVAAWLGLPLITFGIYRLVWYYKIHKEMLQFDSRREISPVGSLLTIMFGGLLIVPPFVSYYNCGKRIRDTQRAAGLPPSCSPGLGLLLMFVFGTGFLYYQMQLNQVVDRYPGAAPGTQVPLFV